MKSKNTRHDALKRVVDFLNISNVASMRRTPTVSGLLAKHLPSNANKLPTEIGASVKTETSGEQIDCAFELAVSR